ncbi:MAG: class B sortase [Clostridia bacterium]|nr:class B sortase [Clostridia bacterium]
MAKGKHSNSKSRKRRFKIKSKAKIFRLFLILILIVTVILLIVRLSNRNSAKNDEEFQQIANDNFKIQEENVKTERMLKLEELQKENSDIVAWLQIEDSNINYPILQTTDNSFYMTHNYKKEYSIDGSLFLDKDYDWSIPSSNLLIYGHNNRGSKEMFVDLLKYKDEEFYNSHKTIRFTTNEEDAEYEIIAVFLSRVYYKSETNVFRYYYFINANNEEEFNEYVEESKKASLYDIEATAKYGDQLLTLSTCEFSQEDGRFAVVARKIEK